MLLLSRRKTHRLALKISMDEEMERRRGKSQFLVRQQWKYVTISRALQRSILTSV
jgi:hypothetical protein